MAVAYFSFAHAIQFLESIGGKELLTEYNPNQYLTLFLLMMFIFGITFEFPVVLVALELVKNGRADAPDAELTRALVQAAGRHGLIILSCGVYSNVIRFLAPLTIPEALLKEGFRLFELALGEVAGSGLRVKAAG